ncbi:MAG: hypothetical protein AAGH57_10415 [Pseudomonadota bacterium]
MRNYLLPVLTAALVTGCAGRFHETHHFATVNQETGEAVNFFRLDVEGGVNIANARYIAGYYDERAVDLFFNEVDSKPINSSGSPSTLTATPGILGVADCNGKTQEECDALLEKRLKLVPIGAKSTNEGAFVMILSTNAESVADTIGSFAESDVVVASAMYLATKEERKEAAVIKATTSITSNNRDASIRTIENMIAIVPDDSDPARKAKWLSVLQALANEVSPGSTPSFDTPDEARIWFEAQSARGGK